MKKVKKLMALLLSMIMVLAMNVTAFAAKPSSGNLTVNVMQDGPSLAGQKIYIFKLLNLQSTDPAKYVANDTYKDALKEVLQVNAVEDENYAIYSALQTCADIQKFANDFTHKVINNGQIVGATGTDYRVSEEISDPKFYIFDNVEPGYYLVYLGGSQTIQSSLVTVNGNTEVSLKSTTPTPDKKADKPSVNIGDVIKYTVDFTIPDITGYNQEKYQFTLKDTLSGGLDFVRSENDKTVVNSGNLEVSVKIGDNNAQNINATVTGRELSLNLKQTVIDNQNPKGQNVTVTYYAQVNENAKTGDQTNGTSNSAKLEYTNDPTTGGIGESTPDVVETPTFAIKVHKYEQGKDKEYLANAIFQLRKDTKEGTIIKMVAENNTGKYTVAKDQDKATVTDLKTAAGQIDTTGANLQIYGLAAGTYYLVETKAPEGFNKLNGVVKIEITKDDSQAGYTITAKVEDEKGILSPLVVNSNVVGIVNNRGTILPGTGGMGTVLFTIAGVVLILGVYASFVISRKRRTE